MSLSERWQLADFSPRVTLGSLHMDPHSRQSPSSHPHYSSPFSLLLAFGLHSILNQCFLSSVSGLFLSCNDAWWVFEMWHNLPVPCNESLVLFLGPISLSLSFYPHTDVSVAKERRYGLCNMRLFLLISGRGFFSELGNPLRKYKPSCWWIKSSSERYFES